MRTLTLFLLMLCFSSVIEAQEITETPPTDVHVKLLLPENKKSFRMGDLIVLTMEFTADRPSYYVDPISDREGQTDKIFVSPENGVNYWRREMMRGVTYARDFFGQSDFTSTPIRVPLWLNETMRFDKPGHYIVKVATDRVTKKKGSKVPLTTNELEFDVREMTDQEEQNEIKRLSLLLDAKPNAQLRQQLAQELTFLTGEAATKEKVRRFFQAGEESQYMIAGFYVARNRDLVLKLLEDGLRDPDQPVNRSYLSAVSGIRLLKESGPIPSNRTTVGGVFVTPERDPQLAEIQNRYLNELVLNLNKRSGQSLTTTAMTILMSVPKSDPNRSTIINEARHVLMQQFTSLHPYDQEYLMRQYWDDLRDPSMVTALKQMLAYTSKNVHDSALKRLIELSSEEARPFALKEICQPESFIDQEIISELKYKELPEVDKCLAAQLRQYSTSSQGRETLILEHKAALAVRFATDNIYREVADLIRERGPNLSLAARAALLAYLLKHNEDETMPLISQTLEEIKPEQEFNFLPKLAELYYSAALGDLIKKRLEGDEPQTASNAAYLIGKHGGAGDEKVLFARLARWQNEWRDRLSEAETTNQGMIERELVWALTNGKSWKLSAEKVRELKLSCLTKMCQQSNRLN